MTRLHADSRSSFRSPFALLFLLLAALLTGPANAQTEYLYIANWASGPGGPTPGAIAQFSIGANGALTPLNPPTVAAVNPTFLTVDSSSRYLYASGVGPNEQVAQFSVGSNGALSPLNPAFTPNLVNSWWVGADPTKAYLYILDDAVGGDIDAPQPSFLQFAVGTGGALNPLNPASTPSLLVPISGFSDLFIDPTGRYLYEIAVGNSGGYYVGQFNIGPGGLLAPGFNSVPGVTCPDEMAFDATGSYAYIFDMGQNCAGPAAIYQYSIGPGGALSPLSPPTAPLAGWGTAIFAGFARSGPYLFAAGRNSNSGFIQPFAIGNYGGLSSLSTISLPGPPATIAADPSEQFLYTPVRLSSGMELLAYSISYSGALTPVPGPSIVSQAASGPIIAFSTITTPPNCQLKAAFCFGPIKVFSNFCTEHPGVCSCGPATCFTNFPIGIGALQWGDPTIVFSGVLRGVDPAAGWAVFDATQIYAPALLGSASVGRLSVSFKAGQWPEGFNVGDSRVVFARGGMLGEASRLALVTVLDASQAGGIAKSADLINLIVKDASLKRSLDEAALVVSGRLQALTPGASSGGVQSTNIRRRLRSPRFSKGPRAKAN